MNDSTIIPVSIHFRDTRRKISLFTKEYNEKLMKEDPTHFKSRKIKPPVINTFFTLVQMLSKHHEANFRYIRPATFRTNNCILGRKIGLNPSTIYRHIVKLQEVGLITSKVWHGTNSDYELELNPKYLVAERNTLIADALMNDFIELYGEIPQNLIGKFYEFRPTFEMAPHGYMIADCNHICEIRTIINKNNELLKTSTAPAHIPLQKGSNNFIKSVTNYINSLKGTKKLAHCIEETANFEESASIGEKNHTGGAARWLPPPDLPAGDRKTLHLAIEQAMRLAMETIWLDNSYPSEVILKAKEDLTHYLLNSDRGRNISSRLADCKAAILKAHFWIKKSPERYAADPDKFFAPDFSGGMYGAFRWVDETDRVNRLKHYKKDKIKFFVHIMRIYLKEPSLELYRKCCVKLRKMQDEYLMELFQKCVADPNEFNAENFQKYRSTT